jgi:hypothetical protein
MILLSALVIGNRTIIMLVGVGSCRYLKATTSICTLLAPLLLIASI